MTHITPDQVASFKKFLSNEKEILEKELAGHGKKIEGDWQGTPAGFTPGEADATDAADAMEELATNIPLVENLEMRLKDVCDALARIEKGTYGLDERTSDPIPVERLMANPAARTTV